MSVEFSVIGDLFPDCEVRADVRCLDDRMGRRCACAFVEGHEGAHFCKWCRKKILGVDSGPPLTAPPLVRTVDRERTHEAAETIKPTRNKIQRAVIDAYREYGDMTSKTAEALPEFSRYGRSTIQKRISELSLVGVLELVSDAEDAAYKLIEERIENPLLDLVERCDACGQLWRPGRA